MKNIQVVDGAVNSTLEVYEIPDEVFDLMFPNGSDVAFVEDADKAFGGHKDLWQVVYERKVDKKLVTGIQGTLHLTGSACKSECFPNGKESDVDGMG